MTVTGIEEVSRSRIKIAIDGEFAFVLYRGELRTFEIEEGQEIKDSAYREIMEEVLPKRAKLRTLNLLKARAYTSSQLRDKLRMGGYPDQIAEEAVEYAASFGYVDDYGYAMDFIEYNKENKSRMRIFSDLLRKGIPENLIREAWEEAMGSDDQSLERDQILRWFAKKNFSPETADYAQKQKMMGFLYRKGFSSENIHRALLDITSI